MSDDGAYTYFLGGTLDVGVVEIWLTGTAVSVLFVR